MRAIALLCLFFAWPASAQECLDWPTMLTTLAPFGEVPVLRMTEQDGRHLRLLGNPVTGTWTIVRLNGRCWTIAGAGYGLERLWSKLPGVPS